MSSYCWKIKALQSVSCIAKGMEVEVIKKNTNSAPLGNEIRDAFAEKYDIKAPTGIYGNKHLFEITKP